MLADWLEQLGYDSAIKKRVAPILKKAERKNLDGFEKEICHLASAVLQNIKAGKLTPAQAQDLFMVVDLYVTKKNLRGRLTKSVRGLLFEGLLFHDFDTPHGPDLDLMRTLIDKCSKFRK